MTGFEWFLLAMVILVPLVIAVIVTLWTLEQARARSKKNRKRPANASGDVGIANTPSPEAKLPSEKSAPAADSPDSPAPDSGL